MPPDFNGLHFLPFQNKKYGFQAIPHAFPIFRDFVVQWFHCLKKLSHIIRTKITCNGIPKLLKYFNVNSGYPFLLRFVTLSRRIWAAKGLETA
jgi:hypothetical protein